MSNTRVDYKSELIVDEDESLYYVVFEDSAPMAIH